uniref:Uncharacterized protein n=1 Tax=Poecilia mexicana TaxID=48701 RepID=A0A3B3WWR2_9TELE
MIEVLKLVLCLFKKLLLFLKLRLQEVIPTWLLYKPFNSSSFANYILLPTRSGPAADPLRSCCRPAPVLLPPPSWFWVFHQFSFIWLRFHPPVSVWGRGVQTGSWRPGILHALVPSWWN